MRLGALLPQGTVRIGHRNPQPPSPPGLIRTGPTQFPRTVQSPNALRPAYAGLFLGSEERIAMTRAEHGPRSPVASMQGRESGAQHASGPGALTGLDEHRDGIRVL